MKLLQKPWFAAILAVLAVGVVFYMVILPRWSSGKGKRAPQPGAVTGTAPTKGPASVEAPPPKNPSMADMRIDHSYASAHFANWVESPQRDPFQLLSPISTDVPAKPEMVSPIASWKLKGVWRQTGGSMAAVNNGLLSEGDTLEGCKVDRIEGDQVWFIWQGRRERLGFDKQEIAALPVARNTTNWVNRLLGPEKEDFKPRL